MSSRVVVPQAQDPLIMSGRSCVLLDPCKLWARRYLAHITPPRRYFYVFVQSLVGNSFPHFRSSP